MDKKNFQLQGANSRSLDLHILPNSRAALQHADDGYSRRGNFGSSLVHSKLLIYSPDAYGNVHGSVALLGRGESRVGVGVESCKIVFLPP